MSNDDAAAFEHIRGAIRDRCGIHLQEYVVGEAEAASVREEADGLLAAVDRFQDRLEATEAALARVRRFLDFYDGAEIHPYYRAKLVAALDKETQG